MDDHGPLTVSTDHLLSVNRWLLDAHYHHVIDPGPIVYARGGNYPIIPHGHDQSDNCLSTINIWLMDGCFTDHGHSWTLVDNIAKSINWPFNHEQMVIA